MKISQTNVLTSTNDVAIAKDILQNYKEKNGQRDKKPINK